MAMLHRYGYTTNELRAAFDRAAAEGSAYLLLMEEIAGAEMLIEVSDITRAVKEQSEIVPLLRTMNNQDYMGVRLKAVYDLKANFGAQHVLSESQALQQNLTPETREALAAYRVELQLANRQRDWARLPWYQRLFTAKPV